MKFEIDTWYWVSHPQEGDIFYPVFSGPDGYIQMDGKHIKSDELKGLNFSKAVMPENA